METMMVTIIPMMMVMMTTVIFKLFASRVIDKIRIFFLMMCVLVRGKFMHPVITLCEE